jgi:cytochrome c
MLGMGGLVSAAAPTVASASQLPNLKAVGPQGQITAIRRYRDTFEVTTADGRRTVFQEANLRFKIDASELGPLPGKPVVLPGGKWGDRATVFFASPTEISLQDK